LSQASHKLAEKLYQQQSQQGGAQAGEAQDAGGQGEGKTQEDEDVVDAEYTEQK
jgi:molecular chaperone DnaK